MNKRILSLVTAALLLVCGMLPAAAETRHPDISGYDVSACRWSDRLIVSRKDGSVVTDTDGTALTDKYDIILEDSETGMFKVRAFNSEDGVNREGLLDTDGGVVIPAVYGDIDVVSLRWNLGLRLKQSTEESCDYTVSNWSTGTKTFWLIDSVDVYYCGTKVGTLPRSDYSLAVAYGDYIAFRSRSEALYVFYDREFNRSPVPADGNGEYSSQYKNGRTLYYHQGTGQQAFCASCTLNASEVERALHAENGKVYDLQGNVVSTLKQNYDSIRTPIAGGFATVKVYGKKGVVDVLTGEEIVPVEYDDIKSFTYDGNTGVGYACAVKDGKIGFVRNDGVVTCDFVYAEGAARDYGTFAYVKDLTGGIIVLSAQAGELPGRFAEVSMRSGGRSFVATDDQGRMAVIGLNGEPLIPFCECRSMSVNLDATVATGSLGSSSYAVWTMDYEDATAGGPAPAEAPAQDDGTWTCGNGHAGNTGSFCPQCGEARPAQGVTCPGCGAQYAAGEVPNFCPSCGTKLG